MTGDSKAIQCPRAKQAIAMNIVNSSKLGDKKKQQIHSSSNLRLRHSGLRQCNAGLNQQARIRMPSEFGSLSGVFFCKKGENEAFVEPHPFISIWLRCAICRSCRVGVSRWWRGLTMVNEGRYEKEKKKK